MTDCDEEDNELDDCPSDYDDYEEIEEGGNDGAEGDDEGEYEAFQEEYESHHHSYRYYARGGSVQHDGALSRQGRGPSAWRGRGFAPNWSWTQRRGIRGGRGMSIKHRLGDGSGESIRNADRERSASEGRAPSSSSSSYYSPRRYYNQRYNNQSSSQCWRGGQNSRQQYRRYNPASRWITRNPLNAKWVMRTSNIKSYTIPAKGNRWQDSSSKSSQNKYGSYSSNQDQDHYKRYPNSSFSEKRDQVNSVRPLVSPQTQLARKLVTRAIQLHHHRQAEDSPDEDMKRKKRGGAARGQGVRRPYGYGRNTFYGRRPQLANANSYPKPRHLSRDSRDEDDQEKSHPRKIRSSVVNIAKIVSQKENIDRNKNGTLPEKDTDSAKSDTCEKVQSHQDKFQSENFVSVEPKEPPSSPSLDTMSDEEKSSENKFDNSDVLGDRIMITWFRDLRRARMQGRIGPGSSWRNSHNHEDRSNNVDKRDDDRTDRTRDRSPLRRGFHPGMYRGSFSSGRGNWKRHHSDSRSSSSRSRSRSADSDRSRSKSRSRSRSRSRSNRRSNSRSRSRSRTGSPASQKSRSPSVGKKYKDKSKKDSPDRGPSPGSGKSREGSQQPPHPDDQWMKNPDMRSRWDFSPDRYPNNKNSARSPDSRDDRNRESSHDRDRSGDGGNKWNREPSSPPHSKTDASPANRNWDRSPRKRDRSSRGSWQGMDDGSPPRKQFPRSAITTVDRDKEELEEGEEYSPAPERYRQDPPRDSQFYEQDSEYGHNNRSRLSSRHPSVADMTDSSSRASKSDSAKKAVRLSLDPERGDRSHKKERYSGMKESDMGGQDDFDMEDMSGNTSSEQRRRRSRYLGDDHDDRSSRGKSERFSKEPNGNPKGRDPSPEDERRSRASDGMNAPSGSAGIEREMDRGMLGLTHDQMILVRQKKEEIEKAYRQDCETFASVVKMLLSKDIGLEQQIQKSLHENLKEIGQRCIQELREFIDKLKADDLEK